MMLGFRIREKDLVVGPGIAHQSVQCRKGRVVASGDLDRDQAGSAAPVAVPHRLLGEVDGLDSVELKPAGDLDIESAGDFRETAAWMLGSGIVQFFVNLAEVDYVDSTGLGSLMQLYREVKNRGGKTWFYEATPAITDIFSLTRLDRVIELHETRREVFDRF